MKCYTLSELTQDEVKVLKARPRVDFTSIFNTVSPSVPSYFDILWLILYQAN